MTPQIDEVAPDLYRISVYVPQLDLQFNHFLVRDESSNVYSFVYPLLISPAWAAFGAVPKAYAAAKGINLYQALRDHSCFEALASVSSAIFTGNTGTNLCDLTIMYVPERERGA